MSSASSQRWKATLCRRSVLTRAYSQASPTVSTGLSGMSRRRSRTPDAKAATSWRRKARPSCCWARTSGAARRARRESRSCTEASTSAHSGQSLADQSADHTPWRGQAPRPSSAGQYHHQAATPSLRRAACSTSHAVNPGHQPKPIRACTTEWPSHLGEVVSSKSATGASCAKGQYLGARTRSTSSSTAKSRPACSGPSQSGAGGGKWRSRRSKAKRPCTRPASQAPSM